MRFSLLLFFIFVGLSLKAQENTKGDKKVVFIIVDGIAADMLNKANTPTIDAIAKEGGLAHSYVGGRKGAYSETPTISAVGYNSLLTGTWVNKHNVYGNSIKRPNYNYPTIFRLFSNANPEKKTAIFSTWEDNRTKLLADNAAGSNFLKLDYSYDGFENDTVRFPHDQDRQYIKKIDTKVAHEAARYIKEEGPDLSWVYLEFSDDMGHRYGDSKQLYDAIAFEDSLIGIIYDSIISRQKLGEDWLFVVTTDHGRSKETGRGHGGQTDRERSTWTLMNKKGNNYFKEHTTAIVDIAPTIMEFLDVKVPVPVKQEWDGVSLLNDIQVNDLEAQVKDGKLHISWNHLTENQSKAEVYVSYTNNANYGGLDSYKLLGAVDIADKNAVYALNPDTPFMKVLFKTDSQQINTWIINDLAAAK